MSQEKKTELMTNVIFPQLLSRTIVLSSQPNTALAELVIGLHVFQTRPMNAKHQRQYKKKISGSVDVHNLCNIKFCVKWSLSMHALFDKDTYHMT